jgi:signal transduction histidine kinase/ActR/RegA family two-component response regulator
MTVFDAASLQDSRALDAGGGMAHVLTERSQGFLSTLPAGRGERRLALAVVLVSVAIFLAAVPFARVPLVQIWAFIPAYESALVINDLITAVLLFGQFSFLRSRALLVLASGYLFTAFMTVSHALTFPGLFSPSGLLGAGPQSTAWMYMFWHGGFPLLVIAYAWLKDEAPGEGGRRSPMGHAGVAVLSSVGAVLVVATGLTLLATAGHDWLPAIILNNRYAPAKTYINSSVWGLSLLALVVLWRRRPHAILDLWLTVVMCAWVFDIALAAVLNAGRFDLGFYAGRIYGLLAASFVLMVLLFENAKLYARLGEAHASELRERQRVQERTIELIAVNAELTTEVTERRRAEAAAEAANRAKSEFLSRMSHELRTPLNGILGFGQLLELEVKTPEERESVEHILKGGRHLLGLINEVLDIARIEAGKLSISLEPVLAQDVLGAALDLVRPHAAARRVSLPEPAPGDRYVKADRQRLQQVLLNLLSNAIKYNRDGGRVRVSCDETAAGSVRIAVSDTGAGITPELLGRLFTPFERLGADQGGIEGTGLGLALSKRLVEAMGGTLTVMSTPGEGSTFTVELPSAVGPTVPLTGVDAGAGEDHPATTHGTVLYIEDNVSNLRLLERVMSRRPGVTLLSAMQGTRGIELAQDHGPQLILLDLHLPDLPGAEVLRRLRDDPRTRAIPVVILSADATPGQITRLVAQGARSYLTKPLDVTALLALVDEQLNGSGR